MSKSKSTRRRRRAVQISMQRAARLARLVELLAEGPRSREMLLNTLRIGLRTFYRETELLQRVGIRVRFREKRYEMATRSEDAVARLPFPDPGLTFAEVRELARSQTAAGRRLAELYAQLLALAAQLTQAAKGPRKRRSR